MPLKRVALTVADEVSPLAEAVGAANTLVFPAAGPAGGRQAHNTDVAGMVAALKEARSDAGRSRRSFSARAARRKVRSPQCASWAISRRLSWCAISLGTGELRETAERLGMRPTISDGLFTEPLPAADLVISTLPGGAADPLSATRWKPDTMVLDVVYAPWPTPFAGSALAAGCPVVSGLTVLLYQAVAQVELMTGRPGPVEAMRPPSSPRSRPGKAEPTTPPRRHGYGASAA